MTHGGAPTVLRLRQKHPTPNGRLGFLAMASILYTFAGFGVYWLRTGSGTVGEGGHVSTPGGLVWFGPLVIGVLAALLIEDRGPLRALYFPRATVSVSADALKWWTPRGGAGCLAWADLGGASRFVRGRDKTTETVFTVSGVEAASIEGPFTIEGTRRSVNLPSVILDARPRDFMPLDPRHPERGCLTRSPRSPDLRSVEAVDPLSDVSGRSAP